MRSADLRARLGHPVVDADGHLIETIPVFRTFFLDYVKDIGGGDLAARFEATGGINFDDMVLRPWSALSPARRREIWATRPSWWSLPAANTLDRATAHLPRLLYERLDEFGIGLAESFTKLEPEPPALDEWAACEITCAEDVRDLFVPHFYFGCEADDPMVVWAFRADTNPLGAKLRAMFSSDIGHWDVPDMAGILAEAWELVDDGRLGEADFR